MIKSLLITLLATSVPVFAETLVSGSVYFESQKTLDEVVRLSAAKDNESILKLISSGQVSQPTNTNKDIVVLATGLTPESPAEFRFPGGPTTFWTLTKFVAKEEAVEAAPTPTPEQLPTPAARPRVREPESNDPTDDDNGRRIWHKVNGRWKWHPANRKPVNKAPSTEEAPRNLRVKPTTPQ